MPLSLTYRAAHICFSAAESALYLSQGIICFGFQVIYGFSEFVRGYQISDNACYCCAYKRA